jgi:hypothetical protein
MPSISKAQFTHPKERMEANAVTKPHVKAKRPNSKASNAKGISRTSGTGKNGSKARIANPKTIARIPRTRSNHQFLVSKSIIALLFVSRPLFVRLTFMIFDPSSV